MSWKFDRLRLLNGLSLLAISATVLIFLYATFFSSISALFNHPIVIADDGVKLFCYRYTKLGLLICALVAIAMANRIARNALLKIRDLTTSLEKISANSLQEKQNPQEWPSELKMLVKSYNNMQDRVHASFVSLTEFSSNIAHELRNPLSSLRCSTEIALTSAKTVEEYRKILGSNMAEYESLTDLIENLLFLARSDHGVASIVKSKISARSSILKIVDYFQAVADEKNISIEIEGEAEILVEPILFQRLINNLLSNALRYTPTDGKVSIGISPVDHQSTQISIVDNGVGISARDVDKVFDRFYRVDPSRSNQSGGIGLGLAIVKSIVDLHQGSIHLDSKLGYGTRVQFQI